MGGGGESEIDRQTETDRQIEITRIVTKQNG